MSVYGPKYLQANTEAPQLPASVRRVREACLRVRPKSPRSDTRYRKNILDVLSPTKRPRRTRAELEDLDATLADIAHEVAPATVRQVFYQTDSRGGGG